MNVFEFFESLYSPLILSVIGLLSGVYFVMKVIAKPMENLSDLSIKISNLIKRASFVYLRKQYLVIFSVSIVVGFLIKMIFQTGVYFFALGIISSAFAGFLAMSISLKSNIRTVEGAVNNQLSGAFKNTFFPSCGASLILNSIGILVILFTLQFDNLNINLLCLMTGVSFVSVFARLGGGIFTKGADVGADLVGKNLMNLNEDDSRNPATIADNVGDNVGDVAGMGADLFETYVVSIASCIIIANQEKDAGLIFVPLLLCSLGIISSLIPVSFLRFKNVWSELSGYFDSSVLIFITLSFLMFKLQLGLTSAEEFYCVLIGALCVIMILKITEYYTSCDFYPVKEVSRSSKSGAGANIISGMSFGFEAVFLPVIIILISILLCYFYSGIYGICLGVMGITAISTSTLTLDIFGAISDNAGGIAEMSHLDKSIREYTDELDAIGNTTKAVTKGYAISSAIFASLITFCFFKQDLINIFCTNLQIDLFDPIIICGLFFGAIIPFMFCGLSMRSVGKAANAVADEVIRQFKENPKIADGTEAPDYDRTIEILTNFSIKEMILPGLLPVVCLLTALGLTNYLDCDVSVTFQLIATMILGCTLSGSLLSIFMTITGALWDNTKKNIEKNEEKGSEIHKSSVVGDTVGDPLKDTSGPALNSLIKLTSLVGMLLIYVQKFINNY